MSNKKELLTKLASLKGEIGQISKDNTNPFFKSKYFDINTLLKYVEPLVQKNGLVLLQPVEGGKVRTEIYEIETGEKVSSEMTLPDIQDPQKMGSAITYYRRYTLQSLLGLQAEDDDDGNGASKASKPTPTQKPNSSNQGKELPWLNKMDKDTKNFTKQWLNVVGAINSKKINSVADVRKHYKVSKKTEEELNQVFNFQPQTQQ